MLKTHCYGQSCIAFRDPAPASASFKNHSGTSADLFLLKMETDPPAAPRRQNDRTNRFGSALLRLLFQFRDLVRSTSNCRAGAGSHLRSLNARHAVSSRRTVVDACPARCARIERPAVSPNTRCNSCERALFLPATIAGAFGNILRQRAF